MPTAPNVIDPKPQPFLAVLHPRSSTPAPEKLSTLPFSLRFETGDYTGLIRYSDREMVTTSADGSISILVSGVLYRPQSADTGAMLLDLYARRGADFVHDLNGRFTLMVVDQRRDAVFFATDRSNSSKLLVSEQADSLIVSNSAAIHPLSDRRIDPVAVACYLVGGFPYSSRTLFEGVRVLEGGSIYRPNGARLEQQRYWEYLPTDGPVTPAITADLKRELEEAIVDAVTVQLRGRSSVYLSLTAGYDSRTILGVLTRRLHVPDIRAFTYTYGAPQPMTDEALAPQLTAMSGVGHRLIEGYNGRLVEALSSMSRLGLGMADVCDEVDAWQTLGAEIPAGERPALFTGDINIISGDTHIASLPDAVVVARMPDFGAARWLEPIIGSTRYRDWLDATRTEIDAVVREYPATDDYYTLRDRLRYRGRDARIFATWREYYAERYFEVVSPLTDERVVDIFMRTPTALRRGKKLYHETVRGMFPDLFTVPRATSASYARYWTDAFRSQAGDVRAWILERPSPFDDLIEPSMLLALLDSDLTSYGRTYSSLRLKIKQAYRWLRRVTGVQPVFARPSFVKPVISAQRVLARALILRSYFQAVKASPD